MNKFQLSIIGTGNIASYLSRALEKGGHTINEVCGRNLNKARSICSKLYTAEPILGFDLSNSSSEIFIIAVSDDSIEQVAQELIVPFDNSLVVHTSGSQPLEILKYLPCSTGVFYPLQSITNGQFPDPNKIPFCIESSDHFSLEKLTALGESLSEAVYEVSSDERKLLHIAAVFASNFSNYMLYCAEQILDKEDINFKVLEPLVTETIRKSFALGPTLAQTGPAVRKDYSILEKHKKMLSQNADLLSIYDLISTKIIENILTKRSDPGN